MSSVSRREPNGRTAGIAFGNPGETSAILEPHSSRGRIGERSRSGTTEVDMPFKLNFLVAMLLVSSAAGAQQRETMSSEPSRMETLRNQTQVFQVQSRATQEAEALAFKAQCMQVTGLEPFCGCLQAKLPASFTFDNYVVVLSKSKQDNGYNRMDKQAKQVYDAIPRVRDSCAATLSTKP
jgi:hypothetical protein